MRLFDRGWFAPVLVLVVSPTAFAQFQFPQSGGAVSDFAGKLSPTTTQRLETAVTEFQRRSGIDFRVVTIPSSSLRGRPIEGYSLGLAKSWAVGRESGRRGLLLLVAIGPADKDGIYHGATRLEVSRNLERDVPPQLASQVTRNMKDSLMAGWFDEAVTIGVDGIVATIGQKQNQTASSAVGGSPPPAPARSLEGLSIGGFTLGVGTIAFGIVSTLLFLAVPLLIVAAVVRSIGGSRRTGYRRGATMWSRRMNRSGGVGMVTAMTTTSSTWSDPDLTSNNASMASGFDDSSSSNTSFDDSSSSSSSYDDPSSSSTSSDYSSSSSFGDSSSSSSSSSDFGGGGSTDSW
jgi:uncharacterized protein